MSSLESMYDIEFKNETGKSYGMIFKDSPRITFSKNKYRSTAVNGKIGDLVSLISGKSNAIIECDFWIISDELHESIRKISQWLSGSGKLFFSDNTDAYYEVLVVESVQTTKKTLKVGSCTVKFVVFPYEFLNDGQRERALIEYNGCSECLPTYRIKGNGQCVLSVNGKSFIVDVPGTIIIDTRRMQSYKADMTNANTLAKGNYEDLIIPNGNVNITISDGFELTIIPNWGYLL